jgi:Ger(x)C family germination protein
VFSGNGRTVTAALAQIQSLTNYPLFFGHTQMILFSEEVARRGIGPFMDVMRRSSELRRQLWPIVIKGKAKNGLFVQTNLEQIPTSFLRSAIETGVRSGRMPDMTLGRLLIQLSTPHKRAPVLNYFAAEPQGYRWLGVAVLNGERMVGTLTNEEVIPFLHLRERKRGWSMVAPCPNQAGEMVFRPSSLRSRTQISEAANPSIRVRVELEGSVIEKDCRFPLNDPQALTEAGRMFAAIYEKQARDLIRQAQTRFRTDIFLFGNQIHAWHPGLWRRLNWKEDFPGIPIQVEYRVNVRRTGLEAR